MNHDDAAHFGRIAHGATPARRAVLEALASCGPLPRDEVAACWLEREPGLRPLVRRQVPQMVSQSLWRLENLGLVQVDGDLVAVTDRGRAALGEAEHAAD